MKINFICLSIIFLISGFSFSQRITVNTTQNPTQLISNLLNSGVCSSISNVTTSPGIATTGNNSPYGSYLKNGTNNDFNKGLIISTGFARNAGNTVITQTLSNHITTAGDADLANAFSLTGVLGDAAYIEFDFVPVKTSISFRYFLASEEYEYNKNYPCVFSDAFAFLLKDNAGGTYQNIALVPGTNIPVGISTVHANLTGIAGGCPAVNPNYFNGYNQNPPNVDGTNFNGSTKALTAFATVIPGHSYHIKLVIADYGANNLNQDYDSAVFIESGSFDLAGYFTDQNAATLNGSAVSCSSNPLVLHPISEILNPTYQWFKDGVAIVAPLGTAAIYQIPVGGTGNYTVVITDSQSGCVDNLAVLSVQVIDSPTAIDQSFCSGATVANLVATGNNIKWYTSLTGGTALAPSTLLSSGTYYASQTVGSCQTTRTAINVIVGNIVPTFNTVTPICLGASLNTLPTTSTNGVTGTWAPAINNNATTVYTFTPISGQCASTVQLTITVNALPVVTASNVRGCAGSQISLIGSPAGGTFSTGAATYTGPTTTYTYTFTNGNGCTATSSPATITVNALPIVTAANVSGCSGSAIPLSGSPAGGIFSTGSATYTGLSTTYTYSYTDGNNCSATSTPATITVIPSVVPSFTPIAPICSGSLTVPSLPLTSNEGIQGAWSPAVISPTIAQTYTFTPTNGLCTSTSTLSTTIVNSFDFSISSGCDGNNFIVKVNPDSTFNQSNANYTWSINGSQMATNSPVFNVTEFVNSLPTAQQLPVSISVTVSDGSNCSKVKSITVSDLYCAIQKGISANGDNKNDFFDLQNLFVKTLSIYNRYGVKVYCKDGYRNEWYGQSDANQNLPDGTYYYVIEFNSNSASKTGWIYLSRSN